MGTDGYRGGFRGKEESEAAEGDRFEESGGFVGVAHGDERTGQVNHQNPREYHCSGGESGDSGGAWDQQTEAGGEKADAGGVGPKRAAGHPWRDERVNEVVPEKMLNAGLKQEGGECDAGDEKEETIGGTAGVDRKRGGDGERAGGDPSGFAGMGP